MAGLFSQVGQSMEKRGVGAVPRVAPQAAVIGAGAIMWGQKSGVMLIGQSPPMKIKGGGFARFFSPVAATMLMNNDRFYAEDTPRNPDVKISRHLELTSASGRLVMDRLEVRTFPGSQKEKQSHEHGNPGFHGLRFAWAKGIVTGENPPFSKH
jgi:hypothetical protein